MQKFNRGDEVVIDWDYYNELLNRDISTLITSWKFAHGKFAVIKKFRGRKNDIQYSVWSPESQETFYVEENSLNHACIEHKSRKVYHDKQEKWICPHCMD